MDKFLCSECGIPIEAKNDLARQLMRQGRVIKCSDCRFTEPNYSTMDYDLYMKTDRWKFKAVECKNRAGWRCQICNDYSNGLHAHHRTYARRGHERLEDLTALCKRCHELVKGIEVY